MSSRREVNVERPEHSWIPFYRELAEKLVNDGWRERQGELVGMLQRLRTGGVPIHPIVNNLSNDIDPFTLFAMFSQALTFENTLKVIDALKTEFDISADRPAEKPFVPYAMPLTIGYFAGYEDIDDEISIMWDIFEHALMLETFEDISRDESLPDLITAGLRVHGIRISKLTSALYWVNPYCFLHCDTVNAVGGTDLGIEATDAETYLVCLRRTWELTDTSFPEINIYVFKTQNPDWDPPNVWVMRAGEGNRLAGEFRGANYVGFSFDFDEFDLSVVPSVDEAEERIKAHRPNRTAHAIRQMSEFLMTMKIGDYVLMPDRDRDFIHHGTIASDPYFGLEGTHKNRRQIEWNESRRLTRDELGWRGRAYGSTVNRVRGDLRDRFLGVIKDDPVVVVPAPVHTIYKLPEDNWVVFHRELARRLIEDEWWKPEKREIFVSLLAEIMGAAGVIDENVWTSDPYSLYLAFNTASQDRYRDAGYDRVRDLFEVVADLPERGNYARRYGVHYWVEMRLEETGVDFLWDFFRFLCDADPVNDSDDEAEFVTRFDATLSHDVPGMASATLSQWLYWIDPTKYLLARRINSSELGLAAHLGLAEPIEGGAKYVEALKAVEEFAKSKLRTLLDINRESTTREMLGLDPIIGPVDGAYDVDAMLADGVFLEASEIERMQRILSMKKNLILQGPPGVGKTFIARKLAYVLMGSRAEERITSVQFHQSYSYEDFVGGFRPDVKGDQMVFTRQDEPFLRMCAAARANPGDDYVMLIDEINRGNLSRVFGELLMLIEADKRKAEFGVSLQHRRDDYEKFFVPENVYIIGTMNLADRSLTGMNVAMRRRFGFVDLKPQFGERVFTDWLRDETEMPSEMLERINRRMGELNATIAGDASLGFNYAVGHSFFCPPESGPSGGWEEWYETVVEYEIRPLLREYWFDNPDTANDHADELLAGD